MSTIGYGRLIDRLEFAAECAAVRDRALALIAKRKTEERAAVKRWLVRPVPRELGIVISEPKPHSKTPIQLPVQKPRDHTKSASNKPGPKAAQYKGKSLHQWADDLGITYGSLLSRISRMGSIEAALAAGTRKKNQPRRGYLATSQDSQGTGGGRHVRDLQLVEDQS